MGEEKLARRRRFPRLLKEYERSLDKRVQQGQIKPATRDTELNDAHRVLESLVFITKPRNIKKAMTAYRYQGDYGKVITDLKQIVQQRWRELKPR